MTPAVSVDFETFYKKNEYDIKTLGASSYISDPRFDPYLISVSDGVDSWAGHPRDFNWDALDGRTLLSHNAGFDSRVYKEMVKRGMAPALKIPAWHCTANLSVYLCMRRDLLRAVEFLLGVTVDKSYRLDADGKTWDDMVAAGVGDKVKAAGRSDALRCHNLWTKYGHLWPERERKLSDITIRQGHRGCNIDYANLERQLHAAQTALIQAETVLPWMAAGKKPTSPKAVAEQCREAGIPAPPVKSRDGDEAYDEWAATYAPKYRWVKAYTDYRVINKYISTLETIKSRLMTDGAFPYDLLYFGAHTGRWSGSGGFNMQNMRKEPLLIDTDGWLVTDPVLLKEFDTAQKKKKPLPGWVLHVLDIRSLFCPRPGMEMYAPDLSQIEPRVLAWVVGDHKMLASMARGESPYTAHARATMGWTGGDMKKEDKDGYALAKARVLGLGYQCAWEKFIAVAYIMAGLDITKDDPEWVQALNDNGDPCWNADGTPKLISGYGFTSKKIVKDYRDQNPLNVGLWKKLDEDFRGSVGGTFEMELPSGRVLRYPEVMRERKPVADPNRPGKWVHKWVTTALAFDQKRNAVVRKPFYGGLLTENLIQAISRDVFGEKVIILDETAGTNVLWTVHDEAPLETQPMRDLYVDDDGNTHSRELEEIMGRPVDWLPGCPLAAEAIRIPHYKK